MKYVNVTDGELKRFIRSVLMKAGVAHAVSGLVAEGLVQTSLRGVDSHGVRLLPHYIEGVLKGRINPDPKYKFKKTSSSTGIFNADHSFGHAAGIMAARRAVELARVAGTGHVAVYNSTHFGAAAYYSLEIAKSDMIGMSFTHADALIRSYGGRRPFLGTNPISFAAPCKGEGPFCLDMASSAITFNKVRQLREKGIPAPHGTGADRFGIDTTDPSEITMLLPMGGHKGYGLSMMVEILCSMLTGMPYGPYISNMFKAPMSEKRFLAHYVIAIRIDCFQKKDVFKERLSLMMKELRNEPRKKAGTPIMVPGDPEKNAAKERSVKGIPIPLPEYEALKREGLRFGVKLDPCISNIRNAKRIGVKR